MENRGRVLQGGTATSPESAHAALLFEQFVSAGTFKSVLSTYRQLCELLRLKPTNISSFYPRLKVKLHSWKAASLWAKLDKRASHKCYNRGKACPNTRVLIIGAGPCGLRAAIESQLLGAKVVLVEKRDRFSRNNVLHLWPFVIHDLRNLGAKKFFGKFCAGSIDHISIRQLQLMLLKVALLLGVEVHENVGFLNLKEPPEDQAQERIGWRACINPSDHPVSQYEFDVLIGADGKRNTLLGFNRKEFRGKLAIAVTANFINRRTLEEAGVEEISGVAFIFNQKFFQEMRELTGIDLENIVYYKDDTHYFVMTAKKQSLLERGVIINDFNDTARLLSAENVDRGALMEYARDAAAFATDYQLPSPDFAVNHYGQADVAMFDFTSMYAAENACRITERRGHKLLQGLVGDSLLEPFWPTGSGCARGFLSSLDVAWLIKGWASGKMTHLQVLAEREAIYRLLAQTTPENLSKDLNQYTLNPSSRYPNLNLHSVLPYQVRALYDSDRKLEEYINDLPAEIPKRKRKRESIVVHPDALLNWCQRQVALHDVQIENLTSSWKNGLALCSILHRYRPDLIDIDSLNPDDVAKNNQLAFDICEKELGIPPVMTGQEMSDCEVPDKLSMVSYLAQIYETFRGEIPVVCQPKSSNDDRAISPYRPSSGTSRSILNRISNKFQAKRKYSIEKESVKDKSDSLKRGRHQQFLHKRRSKDKDKGIALGLISDEISLMNFKPLPTPDTPKESINSRVKNLEMKIRKDAGLRCHLMNDVTGLKSPSMRSEHTELNIKQIKEQLQRNGSGRSDKPSTLKVGRLRKDEWNVKMWEDRITHQEKLLQKSSNAEKSAIKQAIFDSKRRLIEAKLQTGEPLTAEERCKYAQFDSKLDRLKIQLSKGNLEAGERGHNQVAAMTEHMSTIWNKRANLRKDPLPPPPIVNNVSQTDSMSPSGGSEICYFCKKRVYVLERLSAEGLFFHRCCFKCDYCCAALRRGNYAFDKNAIGGGKFYCSAHYRMQKPDNRTQEMLKRKQAFLSNAFDEQERERVYSSILANTEKALSPKQALEETNAEQTSPASPLPTQPISPDIPKQEGKTPVATLLEPLNVIGRDQTPERVEYENSVLDYSEEELLTSELEEEELRQKNFGPIPDVVTNDDEYFGYSSESESDEEAYAEELERSLTADETRKLAERWQRKYSGEHSLMDSEDSSSSSGASDTEICSEDGTSDDINSDEEYSIENEDVSEEKENGQEPVSKTPDVKDDLTVEVPVIDLKGMNQKLEETSTSESDISRGTSASEQDLESDSSSDGDSESDKPADLPPPNIPTIVIDESPPQDIDQDQDFSSMIVPPVTAEPVEDSKTEADKEDKVDLCAENFSSIDSQHVESDELKLEDVVTVPQDSPDVICDKNLISSNSGMEIVEDVVSTEIPVATESNDADAVAATLNKTEEQSLSKSITVEQTTRHYVSPIDDVCKALKELGVRLCDNKSIPPIDKQSIKNQELDKTNSDINVVVGENNNSCLLGNESDFSEQRSETVEELDRSMEIRNREDGISLIDEAVAYTCSKPTVKSPKVSDAVPSDIAIDKSVGLPTQSQSNDQLFFEIRDTSMSSNKDDQETAVVDECPLDLTFVTIRKKNKTNNDSLKWESDNSVSLPWFCEDSDEMDFSLDHKPITAEKSIQNSIIATPGKVVSNDVSFDLQQKPISTDTSLFSQSSIQDSSSEYFTAPEMPNFNSTPIHPSDKGKCMASLFSNDLLSPISENESKSLASDCVKLTKQSCDNVVNEMSKSTGGLPSNICSYALNDSTQYYSDINSNLMIDNCVQSKNSSVSSSIGSSSGKAKYGGSFAEKIRPKSALGDTIYLRSLNINLQKQQFPSLTNSTEKLHNVSSDENKICKKLFHGSDKSLSQRTPVSENISYSYSKGFKRQTSVPLDNIDAKSNHQGLTPRVASKFYNPVPKKDFDTNSQVNHSEKSKSVLLVATPSTHHEPYGDPVSPYTYAQSRPAPDSAFPTKMRPKCDMDLNKLREKREKRKSVHENIQGLPFADEEKASTPIEQPASPGSVFACANTESLKTPKGDECEEHQLVRTASKASAQEKARKEARARARLKSDEELGLSPKNYRKKYQRQLSMSSIYYDELNSDEFYDHENEDLDDDLPDGLLHVKRVQLAEAQSMSSDIDNISVKSAESVHSVICALEASNNKTEEVNLDSSTPATTPTASQPPSSATKTSSSETSPEIFSSEADFFQPEDKALKKDEHVSVDSFGDEEKIKTSNKKSFFSILNFGKGHILKDKSAKNKSKENERASSLPTDLCSKAPAKQKTFTNLKLAKHKDKPKEKRRQKHFSTGTQDIVVIENTFAEPATLKPAEQPVEQPRNTFLSQTKILPKYEVYRNPGVRLTAIPNHIPTQKTENGLAPKAAEDSFSDTEDDTHRSGAQRKSLDVEAKDRDSSEKEIKAQRIIQKVQRQQELKRMRAAQEIQRRMEELEIQQKELEQKGVEFEKVFRAEGKEVQAGNESDLMQEWYKLIHSKNQLMREEQELLIRLKDLELEDRHCHLQQEINERLAQDGQKNPFQISEEKKILTEMLRIVEERDELVALLDQLKLKEEEGEKSLVLPTSEHDKSIPQSSKS